MLIAFDMDDTLYLERDYVRSGFSAVQSWMETVCGPNDFASVAWKLFEEGQRGVIFNLALSKLGVGDASLVPEMVDVYRAHRPSIGLLPDAKSFLTRCCASGHATALITDGPPVSQKHKIDALGLGAYTDRIVVTGEWGGEFSKPHPRAYSVVQEGWAAHDCVFIGDNPSKDFAAPMKLGWARSFRVRRVGALHVSVPTPDGCREVASLATVVEDLHES